MSKIFEKYKYCVNGTNIFDTKIHKSDKKYLKGSTIFVSDYTNLKNI